MKAPRITFSKLKDFYRVSLGNDYYFDFSEKKKAARFCHDVQTFLTKFFVKLNLKHIQIYSRYRDCFFLFFHDGKANYLLTENELKQCLSNCEKVLDRFLIRMLSENANYWAFHDAIILCVELKRAAEIILKENERRSETQHKYEVHVIIDELEMYLRELKTYGARESSGSYDLNFSKQLIKVV